MSVCEFNLYVLSVSTPEWLSVKLVAKPGERLRKANYWLGWHRQERRFAGGSEYRALLHRPDLHERLLEVLPHLAAEEQAA